MARQDSGTPIPRSYVETRQTTWLVLLATIFAYFGTSLFINAVLFQGRASEALVSLYRATGFLVHSALVGGLVSLAVICVMVFAIGRLRPCDVGWTVAKLGMGLAITAIFWMAMNGVVAVLTAVDGDLEWAAGRNRPRATAVVGALIGQLLGNALAEETLFRGFLLPQFYIKAANRFRHRAALGVALLGSSALFAAIHIPNRILVHRFEGTEILFDQAGTFVFGLIMATAFYVTRNLFVAVGLHSLVNEPALIVTSDDPVLVYAVWAGLVVMVIAGWWMSTVTGSRRYDSVRQQ